MSLSVASIFRSGLCTSTPAGGAMSAAVDLGRPLLAQVHRDGLVVLGRDDEFLEVQDDLGDVFCLTPGIVENSWSTPSMRIEVTEAPGIEESRVRRRELPRV